MPTERKERLSRAEIKKNNRALILNAGRQVFCEIGLDACNVRDIIRASTLSTGTFYNYFQSKEEVFEELIDEIILDIHNQAREIWVKALGVKDVDKMAIAFRDFFLIFKSNPDYMKFFIKNQRHVRELRYSGKLSGLLSSLEKDVEEAIQSGRLPPFPVPLATMILFGSVFEILADMINHPERFELEETSRLLAIFFKGGILSVSLFTESEHISSIIADFANIPVHILETLLKIRFDPGRDREKKLQ